MTAPETAGPRQRPAGPGWFERTYVEAAQTALDEILGPNEEDGSGGGLIADIWRLGNQRDVARADVEALRTQLARVEADRDQLKRDVWAMRAATHIADTEDLTDWQRGYRACSEQVLAAVDQAAPQKLDASVVPAPDTSDSWRCRRCGSPRWVAASLTGPVGYGGRAIRQCVPCGRYSDDPVDTEAAPAGNGSDDA